MILIEDLLWNWMLTKNYLKRLSKFSFLQDIELEKFNHVELSYLAEYLGDYEFHDEILIRLSHHEAPLVREGALIGMQKRFEFNDDINIRIFNMMADEDSTIINNARDIIFDS